MNSKLIRDVYLLYNYTSFFSEGEIRWLLMSDLGRFLVAAGAKPQQTTCVDTRLQEQSKWKGKLPSLMIWCFIQKILTTGYLVHGSAGFKDVWIPCDKIWNNSTSEQEYIMGFSLHCTRKWVHPLGVFSSLRIMLMATSGQDCWAAAKSNCGRLLSGMIIMLTQQVLNGQIGSLKSLDFQKIF